MRRLCHSSSHYHLWNFVSYKQKLLPLTPHFSASSYSIIPSTSDGILATELQKSAAVRPDSTRRSTEETPRVACVWPEWVDIVEMLLKRGYLDDKETPISSLSLETIEAHSVRTAWLNYARERVELLQHLPRNDVKVIARYNCPSIDRKVVNSGKRLRAYVGISEETACGSCTLRGNCERAYATINENEQGRTVDLMRLLFVHVFGMISGAKQSKVPLHNTKLTESVRKLLKEIVVYDGKLPITERKTQLATPKSPAQSHPLKQGDWICSKCNFHNFSKNIRCLRCNDVSREKVNDLQKEIEHLPLKKGDWICETCNFFNFARNCRCFICNDKPTRRQINPGEWECESCHYINFRRNMKCLKCDHGRAKRLNAGGSIKLGSDNKIGSKPARSWRFVDGAEEENPKPGDDDISFPDFPVVGGRGNLSLNAEERERWRKEMAETRKKAKGKSEEEIRESEFQRKMRYVQCSDGEDLADWFGS